MLTRSSSKDSLLELLVIPSASVPMYHGNCCGGPSLTHFPSECIGDLLGAGNFFHLLAKHPFLAHRKERQLLVVLWCGLERNGDLNIHTVTFLNTCAIDWTF